MPSFSKRRAFKWAAMLIAWTVIVLTFAVLAYVFAVSRGRPDSFRREFLVASFTDGVLKTAGEYILEIEIGNISL